MRMQMRQFTRLTNAFSKKIENHEAAVALRELQTTFGTLKKLSDCCLDFLPVVA
jgi:hypothetical protein